MATRTLKPHTRTLKPQARPVAISRWRISSVLIVCMLLVARIALRLGEVQVVEHGTLSAQARAEIDKQETLFPRRGTITDSAGSVLAMDVDRESLWVIPEQIDPERVPRLAVTLATLLNKDAATIQKQLTDQDHYWLPVARWLEPTIAERIQAIAADEPGLHLTYEPRRIYPQGTFAAQIVGAVNDNGDGLSGVESFYNTTVKGITGTLTAELDSHKNPIWIAPYTMQPARDGADLHLTIDPLVQHVIETELSAAVKKHNASGGTIIVLDPTTGAIRGMASYPTFDPNRWSQFSPEMYGRNPAVSDVYEPGSTFKVVTVAAGLQARTFTADTTVYDGGSIERFGGPLHNWDWNGHGNITPGDVLYYSSNVGALQFSEMQGPDIFYKAVRAFGFGQSTGVDLGGEQIGIVNWPSDPGYNEAYLTTNGYGQGIAVTPLQLTRAVAAIANGGHLMRPYIVEKTCQGDDCTVTQPQDDGQIIDPGVAWTVRRMMVNSANHYVNVSRPDTLWLVPGYPVGAKTGTSSIPDGNGGYENYTIGSVAGFGPAEGAKYAVLVKIDRPQDDIWGVGTAIPVYQAVMDQLMRHAKVPPDPMYVGPGQ